MITINIREADKMNTEYGLFISFPFSNEILSVMRTFSQRYWHKDAKQWEIPFEKLGSLVEKLPNENYDISGINVVCNQPKSFIDFEFKTNPFQHQIDGFNYGINHNCWLLGDEQGLGKTKQVIDIAVAKKEESKHCLIVCGVNGLKWNWVNEITTHSNETAWILGQRFKNGKIRIGSNADKLNDIKALSTGQLSNNYFIITNVESLRDKNIADELSKLCKNGTIHIVAIDEIHKCFDYDTLITTDIGTLKIGDIVKDQISCSVLSYNETTGENEWKRIVDWHENVIAEQLLELQLETENGVKTIKCTKGHKFFTKNRGWVRAEDLTSYDDIQEF